MRKPNSTVDAAIEAIYETAFEPTKWPQTLATVADVLDAEGTLLFFERADGSYATLCSPSLADAVERYMREGWNHHDVRARRAQDTRLFGTRAIVVDEDVVTPEEMQTLPYYSEFLASYGLAWFMAASVSPCPDTFCVLSVQRAKAKPSFNKDEKATLEVFSHHAERSLRLSTRMMQAELKNHALGEAIHSLGCGVLLLNGTAHVVFGNEDGTDILTTEAADGSASLLDTPLPPSLKEEIATILSVPFGAEASAGKAVLIERDDGEPPSVCYVLPIANAIRPSLAGFDGDVSAILLVIRQEPSTPVDPSIVRDILGLTLGEARVASLIGAGRSPRETASALSITEETTRTVLKRIFAKTGISRQAHLATLLTRLTLPKSMKSAGDK